ncbi:MAG: hypothetical protein ACKOXB_05580 [Flavobacteriales bacterium]
MKRLLLSLVALSALFSCGEPAPTVAPETVITGTITNPDGNTVWIENYKNEKIKIDTLNEKGEFEIKFTLAEATCFEIVNGKAKSYLCLAPADTLTASFDAKNICQTIVYSGKSIALNNYLAEKQRSCDKLMTGEYDSLYHMTPDTFLMTAEVLFKTFFSPFDAIKADTSVNKTLIAKEEEALKYEKAALLLDYNYYHKMMRAIDSVPDIHKITDLTKDVNPNNASALDLKAYQNFLMSYINFKAEEVYKADTTLHSNPDGMNKAKLISVEKNITDPVVKEYLNNELKETSPTM